MWQWLRIILLVFNSAMALVVGYLLILSLAATRASRHTELTNRTASRFLILIPAHNEVGLLPVLFESLAALDYPASLFAIYLVADNCIDQTAAIARAAGATVYERRDAVHLGKGHALNWLLEKVYRAQPPHTAVVFLDADSVVSPNFLSVMAARLERGQKVIQAYYAARNPERSVATGLRYAALAALHYLRPQGRMALGGSAGLKGNGMVLAAELMQRHRWSAAVTEDIEMHMALLLAGERVFFAPDAIVWGEMPDSLSQSHAQHDRWEYGRLQMARRYVPRLARAAWTNWRGGHWRQASVLLDAMLEHLIPPFSVMAGLSALLLGVSLATAAAQGLGSNLGTASGGSLATSLTWVNLSLAFSLLVGQLIYLLAGLGLVRAPHRVYLQLVFAPIYIGWKLRQYAHTWLGRVGTEWVRTTRNEV